MEDTDDGIENAITAGEQNLRTTSLVRNWCFNAEITRTGGRGLIEQQTGLPIGHMGIQCQFAKTNSMLSWLLEDSVYDFYLSNCKGCKERAPVALPNIMSFVAPREEAATKRRQERAEEERKRQADAAQRREARDLLRLTLSIEEIYVLDLLDELDQEGVSPEDPRLEQLANLAPESFTRTVIDHLLPAATELYLPYSSYAAKALLRTPLAETEKLAVASRLVSSYSDSPDAIDYLLANSEKLSVEKLRRILPVFTSMALSPPPAERIGGRERQIYDSAPIKTLFEKLATDVRTEIDTLLGSSDPNRIEHGLEIILAVDNMKLFQQHTRSVFAKLMRRRTLLPKERRDSGVLYRLRKAASKCFEYFPEEADGAIQSLLKDNDETGRNEALRVYRSVLNFENGDKLELNVSHRIGFKRLLWAAVERPDESMGNEAGQFFRNTWVEFVPLAVEHFDEMIGAAASLSEKYKQIDESRVLKLRNDTLSSMERSNRRTAIDSLQGALIQWAAAGAKSRGNGGIVDFLGLYRNLPEDQVQMRANMVAHISKLICGAESLNLVLSDWYRALMDENALIRSSAAEAWENVPYRLRQDFPDLFFDAFAHLLSDRYIIVHQSALRAVRRSAFPKDKRQLLGPYILNLIRTYAQGDTRKEFLVECIDIYASQCCSEEQRKGQVGKLLSGLLLDLEGSALYDAVNRLYHNFVDVPDFVKVALKSIRSDYTRSISIDDCITTILRTSAPELQNCAKEILETFDGLKPHGPHDFPVSLLLITALTRAGNFGAAQRCAESLYEAIPTEKRSSLWRINAQLVLVAVQTETSACSSEYKAGLVELWRDASEKLEIENEDRSKFRNFPAGLFGEN